MFIIFADSMFNLNSHKEYFDFQRIYCAMCYTSMDLTRQALETDGKLFSNFGIIFRINHNFL